MLLTSGVTYGAQELKPTSNLVDRVSEALREGMRLNDAYQILVSLGVHPHYRSRDDMAVLFTPPLSELEKGEPGKIDGALVAVIQNVDERNGVIRSVQLVVLLRGGEVSGVNLMDLYTAPY
jgi:hypothetical protein